jgi:hypothetical protein
MEENYKYAHNKVKQFKSIKLGLKSFKEKQKSFTRKVRKRDK